VRGVFVAGVGMVRFGKYTDVKGYNLGAQALHLALEDAGLPWARVELLVGGHVAQGVTATWDLLHELAWTGIPGLTVANASATGSTAFAQACAAVASGSCDVAAAVGFEVLERGITGIGGPAQPLTVSSVAGMTGLPGAVFGLLKRRRMYDYGEHEDVYARIVVKNFANGALNPMAQRQRTVTVEEVLESPLVADPLHRLECCPLGDGAAAVIVASRRALAGSRRRRVSVLASETGSDRHHANAMLGLEPDVTRRTAMRAYETAGVGPEDLDVVEVHDAFSVEELMYCEQLGLCADGEASKLVLDGRTQIGGDVAVSPSGGLLARGHPGGPTGLSQVVEIVQQIRSEAGDRQHPDAKVGLAHMVGAGGVCVVHVLGR
jgi:acetyl-CoA acetyltransferase